MRRKGYFLKVILGLLAFNSLLIADSRFSSGSEQTKMIELYTSEGCSSCPPADKWLSGLKNHKALWRRIIPLAFHVNYWDYIGWPDRFATEQYGQRQYLHRSQGNIKQVYTPGIMLNGKAWRVRSNVNEILNEAGKKVGVLSISLNKKEFTANFSPEKKSTEQTKATIRLSIALLGFDLESAVKAGENKGEILKHDFVVLAMKSYEGVAYQWKGQIPDLSTRANQAKALVAWVSRSDNIKPLQAVGGWY